MGIRRRPLKPDGADANGVRKAILLLTLICGDRSTLSTGIHFAEPPSDSADTSSNRYGRQKNWFMATAEAVPMSWPPRRRSSMRTTWRDRVASGVGIRPIKSPRYTPSLNPICSSLPRDGTLETRLPSIFIDTPPPGRISISMGIEPVYVVISPRQTPRNAPRSWSGSTG